MKIASLYVYLIIIASHAVFASGEPCPALLGGSVGEPFPQLTKISDGFYLRPILSADGAPLCVKMEKVTAENREAWSGYTGRQTRGESVLGTQVFGSGGQALSFSAMVLEKSRDFPSIEVWVAYVTADMEPSALDIAELGAYANCDDLDSYIESFPDNKANQIRMLVTVTSSKDALITTHMGIGRTVQSLKRIQKGEKEPRNISLYLHSMAAQVMLTENPDQLFMINQPLDAMREIILKSLPVGACHVGTCDLVEKVGRKGEFVSADVTDDERDEAKEILKKQLSNYQKKERVGLLGKPYESEAKKSKALAQFKADFRKVNYHLRFDDYVIIDGDTVVLKGDEFASAYTRAADIYGYNSSFDTKYGNFLEPLSDVVIKHPPIVSISDGKWSIKHPRTGGIIDLDSPIYPWVYFQPWFGSSTLPYLAVDLNILANPPGLWEPPSTTGGAAA